MQSVYGPVTAFTVTLAITLLTQIVKRNAEKLSDKGVQYVALGISVLLIVPFEVLNAWPGLTPIGVYNAFIYALFGWFGAIGVYEVANKQLNGGGGQ